MTTLTLNAKTDLTYEEIYEGYANGKSRLPKILKEIEAGTGPFSVLANAAGIDILRRRTVGGNSTDVSQIGQTDPSDPVAKLIGITHYNSLIANYDGSSNDSAFSTPPSRKYTNVDVRGLTKEPFDLLDLVAGINFSEQVKNAGDGRVGRAAKLRADGSRVVVRDITQIITSDTQDFDTRAFQGDRIGGGGNTGEVHGVDVGIQELVDVKSEALVIGNTGVSFNMATDGAMTVNVDGQGANDIGWPAEVLDDLRIIEIANAEANIDRSKRGAFTKFGRQMAIRSQDLGGSVVVSEPETVLGLTNQTVTGATVGSASVGSTAQESILLGSASVDRLTQIRYGTFQFGTLRVFTSINDTSAVAIVLHPDLLSDLISNQP